MLSISAITKPKPTAHPPEHHIISTSTSQAPSGSGWASYLPSWGPSSERTCPSSNKNQTTGFRNPWPSWHKATPSEMWTSFKWGQDNSPCINLAASHLSNTPRPPKPEPGSKRPQFSDINSPNSPGAKASQLLRIEVPDFSFPTTTNNAKTKAKVTWLGHASALLQLPSLSPPNQETNNQPLRCLFDPIFSARCSPSQVAGPIRSYPPPCSATDLPVIDAVFISHNHFDHMDRESLMAVWRQSRERVRFFVPLGNKRLLVGWGVEEGRVVEMDWWDSAELTHEVEGFGVGSGKGKGLRVWCTPAQHNSFRSTGDADSALWSSWTLEYCGASGEVECRVFFAGDTGYQFHADPAWPHSPEGSGPQEEAFPACPAFAEIRERIGPPDLLLLPVSVGATFAYLRSFVPLPDWVNPMPRHGDGVTGANHMGPWDAVTVMKVMTEGGSGKGEGEGGRATQPVAVAMHWGTFVTDPVEVLRTLGELEWACGRQGVRFARDLESVLDYDGSNGPLEQGNSKGVMEPCFVALNHGQSICI